MKVYIVIESAGYYAWPEIKDVFAREEDAKEFADSNNKTRWEENKIQWQEILTRDRPVMQLRKLTDRELRNWENLVQGYIDQSFEKFIGNFDERQYVQEWEVK